jgi:hypothetical protein
MPARTASAGTKQRRRSKAARKLREVATISARALAVGAVQAASAPRWKKRHQTPAQDDEI